MIRLLLLFILIVPLVELWVLIGVGQKIGAGYTILLVLFTGALGGWLMRRQGLETIQLIRLQLSRGEMPGLALIDGACILAGGIGLLTPGFITDLLGLFLLIPYTRNIFKAWLKKRFEDWVKNGRFIIIRR
jgi:UPF0716 protein FxsA